MYNENQIINNAAKAIQAGHTMLYPSDTIWGIGCDATNNESVNKIIEIKKRAASKGLIVLVDSIQQLLKYVETLSEQAITLIQTYPTAVTIVYQNPKNIATAALAADGSIAIRVCKFHFLNQIIAEANVPLLSTSANMTGEATPAHLYQIDHEIRNAVDYVIEHPNYLQLENNPSRIVRFDANNELVILR